MLSRMLATVINFSMNTKQTSAPKTKGLVLALALHLFVCSYGHPQPPMEHYMTRVFIVSNL